MAKASKRNFENITPEEERDLIESSERGEWVSVGEEQRRYWEEHVKNWVDNERERISISVPKRDLLKLKTRAAEEGMPYQTLINSILHKYVEGR